MCMHTELQLVYLHNSHAIESVPAAGFWERAKGQSADNRLVYF